MTPLEIVGAVTLTIIGVRAALGAVTAPRQQLKESIREAFDGGMLCAADIVTHEGHEETAGKIRQIVQLSGKQ